MFKRNKHDAEDQKFLEDEQAALEAGYWHREEWAGGEGAHRGTIHGWVYSRPAGFPKNADSEDEARRGMVRLYRADVARQAEEDAEFQAAESKRLDADRRAKLADAKVARANADCAADSFRITRRPDGLEGWSVNGGRNHLWETAEAAIADQAGAADMTRRHRAFRESVAAEATGDGLRLRWSRDQGYGNVLEVWAPAGHPRAPMSGELVEGYVYAGRVRGFHDLREWLGSEIETPHDFPEDR